tara:strand:- start:2262 stop:3305 length:1044 start_codon:yes stop_codon:yes gene_type:complete
MNQQTLQDKTHRRKNILTGEWVLVSPHRTKRPWQGKKDSPAQLEKISYDPSCYLCPGNKRANGEVNPNYEGTYSFKNDFAALNEGADGSFSEGLIEAVSETGLCKVICYAPDHALTLPLMSQGQVEEVIDLWQKEFKSLGEKQDINHVQIFENKGAIMGCSNPHPHGQIWAQKSIPGEAKKKYESQKNYWNTHKRSLLSDYVDQELKVKERLVLENRSFVALVPFWATWPYETMIIPKNHHRDILTLTTAEKSDFAAIMIALTIKYDNLFKVSFPYSAGIHQAPTNGESNDFWHFHFSFLPPLLRSAEVKKFMVGYEMFADPQRDITAEKAAETLRMCDDIHYSKKN